ncbi:MAG: hypothetical protein LBT14_05730 [Treponema sp.]|jgi:hypothetical protein|nr:hypothetical protein [Treponema sp.]
MNHVEFFNKMDTFSDFLVSIFTVKGIAVCSVLFFGIIAGVFFLQSFYKAHLLVAAASGGQKKMSIGAVVSAILEALGKIAHNFLTLLPILAGIIVALLAITGVMKVIVSINDFVEREKRIHELSVAIKYLEQSEKVLAVRVLSVTNGVTQLRIDYSAADPDNTAVPFAEWRREITIPGTDIFFDCMVLNFTYSEITSGRQKNIAIPYRIFSNVVSAQDGIYLHASAFEIPEEDDYGFIPSVYRERLLQLLTDADFAQNMGVRSVNGSALHRWVNTGDRFSIKIEQTGGIRFN